MRTPFSIFWHTVIAVVGLNIHPCLADTLTVFSAKWCGACQQFKKDLGDEATELKGVPLNILDFDANRKLARDMRVRSIPTFILQDDDGTEIARKVGYDTMPQLEEWLDKSRK